MDKKELRKIMKRKRDQMSSEQVKELSEQICLSFMQTEFFDQAAGLLVYAPLSNEVDVWAIIEKAWELGKKVAFPKVYGDDMDFFQIDSREGLASGFFGVMEPQVQNREEKIAWKDTEKIIVIVPGVTFDKQGGRMGYGKGYYDKYLQRNPSWIRIGVAYDLQVVEELPTDEHDQRLQVLITESEMIGV